MKRMRVRVKCGDVETEYVAPIGKLTTAYDVMCSAVELGFSLLGLAFHKSEHRVVSKEEGTEGNG